MSDEAEYDLSGQWHGVFNYPAALPPTEFDAVLRDVAGRVSGETSEAHYVDSGHVLHATLEGSHDRGSIHFRKTYDDFDADYETVIYEGAIDPAGDEISGRWTVPGAWSGTFLMVRAAQEKAAQAQAVGDECVADEPNLASPVRGGIAVTLREEARKLER